MADACFYKSEVVITQPWIEYLIEIGVQIDLDIAKRMMSLKPKPEVDFQLYGHYLEKSI